MGRRHLRGIETLRGAHGKRHLHRAAALLRAAEDHLRRAHPDLKRVTPAGEQGLAELGVPLA